MATMPILTTLLRMKTSPNFVKCVICAMEERGETYRCLVMRRKDDEELVYVEFERGGSRGWVMDLYAAVDLADYEAKLGEQS